MRKNSFTIPDELEFDELEFSLLVLVILELISFIWN